MNLICFPHYTCGGLLCDIFNQTFSNITANGGVNSIAHALGKIGDADTVMIDYDQQEFVNLIQELQSDYPGWIGTHCWPGHLDLSVIEKVIVITTTTSRSKLYRWARAYHHYYAKSDLWNSVVGQPRMDKERETAKNYLSAFAAVNQPNVINIEFAEVVDNSMEFQQLTAGYNTTQHLHRWRDVNSFLYATDIWNSNAFKRFYEAEAEHGLGKHYVYQ